MTESYLEIREVATGYVVTVIEILSPTNKRGKGRETYEDKRQEILASPTNLVEIDLLRIGKPMPIMGKIPESHYRLLVARKNSRPLAQLYPFSLRSSIPKFSLPLKLGDTEPVVDLQQLLGEIYEQASFDLAIDYTQQPIPPLKEEDKIWLQEILKLHFPLTQEKIDED